VSAIVDEHTEAARAVAGTALRTHDVGPGAVLSLVGVSENVTFRLDDPARGERSMVRVHRPGYHGPEAIRSELAWLRALRAERIVPVPEVVPATDGTEVIAVRQDDGRDRHVVRFRWLDGTEPSGDRLVEDFAALGRIAAALHGHARRWRRPPGFTRLRWDWETAVGPRGHWGRWQDGPGVGPAERDLLARAAGLLRDRLAVFGTGPDRFGLVHADMRVANLLVRPDDPTIRVIDFDDCGFSWFLYDFAASVSFIEDDPRVPELAAAWVGGYREVAPLTGDEERELPTFVLLRRLLLLAWIGSHPEAGAAGEYGPGFAAGTCRLAEDYLARFSPRGAAAG
jgi:Ser/Thr protein kinase RdoA (MazF antagonist)